MDMFSQEKDQILPEEYLASERASEIRREYLAGQVFDMAGASREHNQISANIVRLLGNQLLERPCSVFSSDMKVGIEAIEKYTYPDIVAVCEAAAYADENHDVLLNPLVIIEILSDTTEAYDRGDKFAHYQLLNSFAEYLLVSQYYCRVEKFIRQEDGTWIYSQYQEMEQVVEIEAIGCGLPLSEIFRKVSFDPHRQRKSRQGNPYLKKVDE